MSRRQHSISAQAQAVRNIARLECVKPLRPRSGEAEVLIEMLTQAAETLERLAREAGK